MAKLTTGRAAPLFVAAATSVCAGTCAALVLALRGELRILTRGIVAIWLVVIGALGTAAAFFLFFLGASQASAIEAVLCLQIEPAYSLLLAWLFLGHRPTRRRLVALGVLLLGITLAIGDPDVSPSPGVWILLVTPLCWQVSHLIVLRQLAGISPWILTGARYVHGGWLPALTWLVSGAVITPSAPGALARVLPLLALQGVILSYGGTLLWYQAITRLDLARATAIVVPSIPLLSLGASFTLLGEAPSAHQWVGFVLTAVGIVAFITTPDAVRTTATAPLTAGDTP